MADTANNSTESLPPARYSFGADEHIFVELDEQMSLQANFKAVAITSRLKERDLDGIVEICPANASYQVRFNPDELSPYELMDILKELEQEVSGSGSQELSTRLIEVPVLYNDPWTHETLMRFRERHQDPDATDLEYAARINGFDDVESFIKAHEGSPWFVSMVGFVAGLPFMYQMVERERQIQVPKYLRPRTDTPALTVGYGGCFACIYSVRGAGGYQMFGITPIPIFDPEKKLPAFEDFMIFFKPGDIIKFRGIDRDEYDELRSQVEDGSYRYKTQDVTFNLGEFAKDPESYNKTLLEDFS